MRSFTAAVASLSAPKNAGPEPVIREGSITQSRARAAAREIDVPIGPSTPDSGTITLANGTEGVGVAHVDGKVTFIEGGITGGAAITTGAGVLTLTDTADTINASNLADVRVIAHLAGRLNLPATTTITVAQVAEGQGEALLRDLQEMAGLINDLLDMDKLIAVGYDPVYGARPLKRAIQQHLENPLAQAILRGEFGPGDRILTTVRKGELLFQKQGKR